MSRYRKEQVVSSLDYDFVYLHSVLMWLTLMGMKGDLAACLGRNRSLHKYLDVRVSVVVTRQKAALVFITGRGLPARMAKP